jgi:hypothetical protein
MISGTYIRYTVKVKNGDKEHFQMDLAHNELMELIGSWTREDDPTTTITILQTSKKEVIYKP